MTRAVIYARYSTDLQSDRSIEDQFFVCRGELNKRVQGSSLNSRIARSPGLPCMDEMASIN